MPSSRGVPAWSRFSKASDHRRFVRTFEQRLLERGLPVVPIEPDRSYALNSEIAYRLDHLAAMCATKVPREKWVEVIDFALGVATSPLADFIEDPDRIWGALRVRVMRQEVLRDMPSPVMRPVDDVLAEVIAVDTPATVEVLDRSILDSLGRTDDELFEIGRENVLQHEPVEWHHIEDGDLAFFRAIGDHFFVSTWALLLDGVFDPGEYGEILAMPARDILLVHLIEGRSALEAMNRMMTYAWGRLNESDGPLTSDLYWRRSDGNLVRLPVDVATDTGKLEFRIQIHPDFTEALNALVGS